MITTKIPINILLENKLLLSEIIELYLFNHDTDTLSRKEFFVPNDEYSIKELEVLYQEKKKEYFEKLRNTSNNVVFLLQIDNKIVGTIFLENNNFIYDIIIDKNYRGNGYSKVLMNYVINELADQEKISLYVKENNIIACKLYDSFGFEFIEKKENDNLLMERYN